MELELCGASDGQAKQLPNLWLGSSSSDFGSASDGETKQLASEYVAGEWRMTGARVQIWERGERKGEESGEGTEVKGWPEFTPNGRGERRERKRRKKVEERGNSV